MFVLVCTFLNSLVLFPIIPLCVFTPAGERMNLQLRHSPLPLKFGDCSTQASCLSLTVLQQTNSLSVVGHQPASEVHRCCSLLPLSLLLRGGECVLLWSSALSRSFNTASISVARSNQEFLELGCKQRAKHLANMI